MMDNNFFEGIDIDYSNDIKSYFEKRIQQISSGIIQKTGDAATATQKAYGIINGAIDRQAYYLSYLDSFRLIGIFFLIVIPFVIFLRVKKNKEQDAKEMMKAASEAH